MESRILVRLDDGIRLAGSLLAAGDWPEHEQALKAYKAHRAADAAHRALAAQQAHPAVRGGRALAGDGQGLGALFSHGLNDDWPAGIPAQAFKTDAQLEALWAESQADWEEAETDARAVMQRADLAGFIGDLLGPQPGRLVFAPNLLFPGRQAVAAVSPAEVVVALNPPIAWGTSHPWRYAERPDEVLARLSEAFLVQLFSRNLPPSFSAMRAGAELFGLAGAVLFVRQAEGQAAGDQFMVMEKKTRGLKGLPAVVAALESALAARRAGQHAGLADYLPQLAGLLA